LFGFIHVGCVPQNAQVNMQPMELGNSAALTQEEKILTAIEKQRILLLQQDYQGALDLMPLVEIELLLEESLEVAAERSLSMYCYLYAALCRDEEALQKIMEYEQSRDTTFKGTNLEPVDWADLPAVEEHLFILHKVTIMSRLNMANEIAKELNALLDNKDVGHVLFTEVPLFYAMALNGLICAQLVKGDLESAKNNIIRCRDYMYEHYDPVKGFSGPASFGRKHYFSCHENLNELEYFIDNLTNTHFVRYVKVSVEPPERDPECPVTIKFGLPLIAYEFVSKVDGSLFTTDDFRKATSVSPHDLAPVLDPFADHQTE